MADSTPKISLSLLDLLFCAFGGVIVMAVIFISIAGNPEETKSQKSGHINVAIVENGEVINGMCVEVYPDSMQRGISSRDLINDSIYFYGAQFHLYPYGDYYNSNFANNARLSFKDYTLDTLYLKLNYQNLSSRGYSGKDLQLRVARFQSAEWDTIYVDFPSNISEYASAMGKRCKIPLR